MIPPPAWPLEFGNFWVWLVPESEDSSRVILERNAGTRQRAYERVQELQDRGRTAFYTTTLVKGAYT